MFGQPKQFFALAEMPIDVLYIDGEIDEIKLGVRNLAIIGAILLVLDMALPSSSVGAASSQEEMFPAGSDVARRAVTRTTACRPFAAAQIYLLPTTFFYDQAPIPVMQGWG